MDELLHHCLRELSFDGDLGCNVSRLGDFVYEFYAHNATSHPQNLDDNFHAFVWSLVVQHPSVRVGVKPAGVTSEVWIAPQNSAIRKAKAKGQAPVETTAPELDIVPDAKLRSLQDLVGEFGDELRIAVNPEAVFAAISGSHIRSSKLSPMVYTALQIITRGRDAGLSVVELGYQSKYDQKTCFYLVKQLIELDLVVKVRRGGIGSHFCIHKYFFERSTSWREIREEADLAKETLPAVKEIPVEEAAIPEEISTGLPFFSPIDSRHLSSFPLVKGRVVKLLTASKNYIHASNNMLLTIGFANPTKTDRRFFQSRIRELLQQGIIEKVLVPSNRKSSSANVKCFRLVIPETRNMGADEGIIVEALDVDEKEVNDTDASTGEITKIQMNVTINKQITNLLDQSGIQGMTLNELSQGLGNFDKRTVELLLTRAEKYPPPPHLSDLGIADLMETCGRERRHRYLTVAAYHQLVAKEQLDKSNAGYTNVDLSHVGEFAAMHPDLFYNDSAGLFAYQDSFKSDEALKNGKPVLKTHGRPKKIKAEPKDNDALASQQTKRKPAAKRKKPSADNDMDASEVAEPPKKKPRVSKAKLESLPKKRDRSKKAATTVAGNEPQTSKKRGKTEQQSAVMDVSDTTILQEGATPEPIVQESTIPKKRGRSSRNKLTVNYVSPKTTAISDSFPANGRLPIEGPTEGANTNDDDEEEEEEEEEDDNAMPVSKRLRSARLSILAASPHDIDAIQDIVAEPSIHSIPEANKMRGDTPPVTTSSTDEDRQEMDATSSSSNVQLLSMLQSASGVREHSEDTPPTEPSAQQPSEPSSQAPESGDFIQPRNAKINVSHLRRENEFFRIVVEAGGILNVLTNEFGRAHMRLIETMIEAGEPTSAPLKTNLDKRTIYHTIDIMESRKRIVSFKTTVTNATGSTRPAYLIHLPELEPEKINAYLATLHRTQAAAIPQTETITKISERLEYGAGSGSNRGALPLQILQMEHPSDDVKERWSKNTTRAAQMFNYEDATIREMLLNEHTTMGQLYGFIVPKLIRTREFHILVLKIFESSFVSSNVVSKDKRILNLQYFFQDLPLAEYLSIVSAPAHSDEITALMSANESRQAPVRDLDQSIHTALQIGRSRGRTRVLDMLSTLRALQLVSPLQRSTSETPLLTCEAAGDNPSAFDAASLEGWTNSTPQLAPIYWQFHTVAPLHYWAASETSPPFWKNVDVSSSMHAAEYWNHLKNSAFNQDNQIFLPVGAEPATKLATCTVTARSIRRPVSWNTEYAKTWHQAHYLKKFADPTTAKTPLQSEDGGAALISKISWVSSMPESAVRAFYEDLHTTMLGDLDKVRSRPVRSSSTKKSRTRKKASTPQISATPKIVTKTPKESEWEDIVHRAHQLRLTGSAAIRVRQIRQRFMQTGSLGESEKWQAEILQALRNIPSAVPVALPGLSQDQDVRTAVGAPPALASNPPEKSIAELMQQQGPPLPPPIKRVKAPRRKPGEEKPTPPPKVKTNPMIPSRRVRFNWTREYEELARDAAAIIRARCRSKSRLEWMALEQVFPAVPRNSVRQRLITIMESPGVEAYMNRLEDRWYDLWMQYRGTELLPDEDVASATNFNLIQHIEFLRKHVDKNALRVGFSQPEVSEGVTLPSSIEAVFADFDIEEPSTTPAWDFMWTCPVEENREKFLHRQAFTIGMLPSQFVGNTSAESVCLAEAALKMTMGTPNDAYDPSTASLLLRSLGEQPVALGTKSLLSRNVLSKLQRDSTKPRPGRIMKISEINQNALGGSILTDTFQDATALEDISFQQQNMWREWPLLATDGDTATLIQLVSDDKVDFQIDTSQTRASRDALDWNSKKSDDDQMETIIQVQFSNMLMQVAEAAALEESPDVSMESGEVLSVEHGTTVEGTSPCCRQTTEGLIDCMGCLEAEAASFVTSLPETRKACCVEIISVLEAAGPDGLTKQRLLAGVGCPVEDVLDIVATMTAAATPLVFWTGYSSIVLVSSQYLYRWSVLTSDSPPTRVFPRRWLDISGSKMDEIWDAAMKAVIGVVVLRPGIAHSELRWRLRSIYDRCEVRDIVHHLQRVGLLASRSRFNRNAVAQLWEDEAEAETFWFVTNEKHWYQA